jgi:hypothetical protein
MKGDGMKASGISRKLKRAQIFLVMKHHATNTNALFFVRDERPELEQDGYMVYRRNALP